MNATSGLGPTLGAVAAAGLPGAPGQEWGPLTAPAWDGLVRRARQERAVPLVVAAVETGRLRVTAAQAEELAADHEEAMRTCIVLERCALVVGDALARAGITHRLLKGAGVARLDYPDPAWRAFGDVDVLVPTAAYDDAVVALEQLGAWRRYGQVRPGFDRRFGKGACLVLPDGHQVDLHRTFVAGPFGLTVDLDRLFAGSDAVTIGSTAVPVLAREHRFLHACYHAMLGDAEPRLVALRDVAQLLAAPDLELEQARATARQWRAEVVVARAVDAAWRTFGLTPDPRSEWAATHRPDRYEARALAAYTGEARSYARQMAAGVHAIRSWPEKAAYVRALLAVDPEYARRHDGGYRRRLRRAWQARSGGRRAA